MSVYAVDKLMAQTRKLAADFRQMTGQPLPVTAEIAIFDEKKGGARWMMMRSGRSPRTSR